MEIKNVKGKFHPSSSSSSSSPSSITLLSPALPYASMANLLPGAIIALLTVLSLEDHEVLAYMITRSMKASSNPSSITQESKKKFFKKAPINGGNNTHKSPMFDCDCFDCYTSYWFRWDSSPNRELIHQAIEAFEDHLADGEKSKKSTAKGRRREKPSRRVSDKRLNAPYDVPEVPLPEVDECSVFSSVENNVVVEERRAEEQKVENTVEELTSELPEMGDEVSVVLRTSAVNSHKSLARKVLPDVLGLFNFRLWSLWSPQV